MSRAAVRSTARIATVMSSPMIGSASGKPERDTAGAEQHGQRGEAVGAGVQPVGDQRGRADPAADADAVERDEFVADEADEAGGGDPADVLDRRRVDQPADRLVAGDDRGQRDHRDTNSPARSSARPNP